MGAKRYKEKQKKNIKNFIIFYICISILFIASYTLSRYVNTTTGSPEIGIAKFDVTVNNMSVTENEPFELNFSDTSKFVSKKIAPSSLGYFEIIINPTGTEVSLEYEFNFKLDELNKKFKLAYFTIDDSKEQNKILDNTIVKGDLLLPNTQAFTKETNIKVYWTWDEEIHNPDINSLDNKNIGVSATIKQKIK